MEPTFFIGDFLKVDCTFPIDEIYAAPKDAEPSGNIIAYRVPTSPLVYLVIERSRNEPYSFTTQGDPNQFPDAWVVQENDIIGKIIGINLPFWT
jgi:hypothetical protein